MKYTIITLRTEHQICRCVVEAHSAEEAEDRYHQGFVEDESYSSKTIDADEWIDEIVQGGASSIEAPP